ncbi:MAG: hypothetical protein H6959_10325 [Chromatiaceae bacterium]|nr:hypothetical protein [Chromatiaceae bacterium]MCP5423303.1 hypothetical protein [Chromatiaceae bacterium]
MAFIFFAFLYWSLPKSYRSVSACITAATVMAISARAFSGRFFKFPPGADHRIARPAKAGMLCTIRALFHRDADAPRPGHCARPNATRAVELRRLRELARMRRNEVERVTTPRRWLPQAHEC